MWKEIHSNVECDSSVMARFTYLLKLYTRVRHRRVLMFAFMATDLRLAEELEVEMAASRLGCAAQWCVCVCEREEGHWWQSAGQSATASFVGCCRRVQFYKWHLIVPECAVLSLVRRRARQSEPLTICYSFGPFCILTLKCRSLVTLEKYKKRCCILQNSLLCESSSHILLSERLFSSSLLADTTEQSDSSLHPAQRGCSDGFF